MPEDNNTKQVQIPDVTWQDLSFKFNGQWLPNYNGILIGPENYQTLQNLRYTDDSIESISGYTKVNTTPISTYTYIHTGQQLRSLQTQTSYILVHASASGTGQGRVYLNRTAPGSAGDFDTTGSLSTSGNYWYADSSVDLVGRFSAAPRGNIAYCNGEESMIFGGDEQSIAAAFSIDTDYTTEVMPNVVDRDFSAASAWANVDITSYDEETDENLYISGSLDQYCTLPVISAPTAIGSLYRLSFDIDTMSTTGPGSIGLYIYDFTGVQILGLISGEIANGTYSVDFTASTTGGLRIKLGKTTVSVILDNFSLKLLAPDSNLDVTDKVNSSLYSATDSDTYFTWSAATNNMVYVFTTRPIQAVKFYVGSANVTNSTLSGWVSKGSQQWSKMILTDGTITGSVSLAKTGVVSFNTPISITVAKPTHFEELYLYAYAFLLSAGSAKISYITVNTPLENIVDVWDGVYRQPIQFQVLDGTAYFDYTLQVQESSDLNAPIGALLDGLTSSDKLYIMFEDRMSAIKFTMLGDLVNALAETISVKYWDGGDYKSVSITDGTKTSGTTSFSQTGLVSWTPNNEEEPRTLFGSYGYVYEISFSGTLTGTKGTTDIEVVVDICTGVPAQVDVLPFDWSAQYGTRLMLGSYSAGKEGNRMDYSVSSGPDVWNGFDSSDNGKQSLYFGGEDKIVAGTQIYNRFGANVYSMLLVLKHNEVYILVGDTPDEFTIYPVAKTIGCIAPLSLATVEVGIDLGGGLTRNIAIWLSHSGPVMFDGAILVPVNGIECYFDPTDSRYVKFSLMSKAVGWVDSNYKEYNIVIPS